MADSFKDLRVWQNAMTVAMRIFEQSKSFPREERYSLTDQIRRSSRSVAASISERWKKRRYQAAFVSKLNDAEAEGAETQTWLEFAKQCEYLDSQTVQEIDDLMEQVLAQLHLMIRDADRWCLDAQRR
jgi:four helix bundle protein